MMPISLVGADPEFLLSQGSEPIGAWILDLPDKHSGKKLVVNGVGFHRDGFGLEINPAPHQDVGRFLNHLILGIQNFDREHLQPKGLLIEAISAVQIPVVDLLKDPRTPIGALARGCDPSLNAYLLGPSQALEVPPEVHPWREFAGHLHFSWRASPLGGNFRVFSLEDPLTITLIKLWDQFLGLIDMVIFGGQRAKLRRIFYGQAGDFRLQPHGLEYRVPSSESWGHPAMVGLYVQAMKKVAELVLGAGWREINFIPEWSPEWESRLQKAINLGEGAREMVRDLPGVYLRDNILELADRREELQLTNFHYNWIISSDARKKSFDWNINWPAWAGVETKMIRSGFDLPADCWRLYSANALARFLAS